LPADVVIDVGAQHHPPEESTETLIARYEPKLVLAFDAHHKFKDGIESREFCTIVRRHAAVWIHSKGVSFWEHGMDGGVRKDGRANNQVDSVNIISLVSALPPGEIILKLDCEGAEYVLLDALHRLSLDERLALCIVEWHPPITANGWYLSPEARPELRCPVIDWQNDFQLQ